MQKPMNEAAVQSKCMLATARPLRLLRLRAALNIVGIPLRLASDFTFWLQVIHARLETTLANEEASDFMRATARPLRLLPLRAALKVIGLPLRLASDFTWCLQGTHARLETTLANEKANH